MAGAVNKLYFKAFASECNAEYCHILLSGLTNSIENWLVSESRDIKIQDEELQFFQSESEAGQPGKIHVLLTIFYNKI